MTTNAGPISIASVFRRRQAITSPALRLRASSRPLWIASISRASSSSPLDQSAETFKCRQSPHSLRPNRRPIRSRRRAFPIEANRLASSFNPAYVKSPSVTHEPVRRRPHITLQILLSDSVIEMPGRTQRPIFPLFPRSEFHVPSTGIPSESQIRCFFMASILHQSERPDRRSRCLSRRGERSAAASGNIWARNLNPIHISLGTAPYMSSSHISRSLPESRSRISSDLISSSTRRASIPSFRKPAAARHS
jgi:hypothetical protein